MDRSGKWDAWNTAEWNVGRESAITAALCWPIVDVRHMSKPPANVLNESGMCIT